MGTTWTTERGSRSSRTSFGTRAARPGNGAGGFVKGWPFTECCQASCASLPGMAKRHHAVFMSGSLEDIRVRHRDVVFFVYRADRGSRSAKFGELRVSQGAVVWRGRRDKKGRKLNWLQFERLMQEQGRRAEQRRVAERVSVPPSKRRR